MSQSRLTVQVVSVFQETPEIRSFKLIADNGLSLPSYEPGAHIDLYLGSGLIRQYSLCGNSETDGSYRIAVKREPNSRGGSRWIHDSLSVGSEVRISHPRNAFSLAVAPYYLLFGGGIGLTPLLSMAYYLSRLQKAYRLVLFMRDQESIPFSTELNVAPLSSATDTYLGLSPAETSRRCKQILREAPNGSYCYTCGPAPFMTAVEKFASELLTPGAFHKENFVNDASTDKGKFVITLSRSGREIEVPEGISALEALRVAGHPIQSSCEVGVCGTCVTPVLSGVPLHNDTFLTESERSSNKCFAPCVSRALTPNLVLDL